MSLETHPPGQAYQIADEDFQVRESENNIPSEKWQRPVQAGVGFHEFFPLVNLRLGGLQLGRSGVLGGCAGPAGTGSTFFS